jgi:hypothetical protein
LEIGVLQACQYLGIGTTLISRYEKILPRIENLRFEDPIGLAATLKGLGFEYLIANKIRQSKDAISRAITILENSPKQKMENFDLLVNCYLDLSYLLLEHFELNEFLRVFQKTIQILTAPEVKNNRLLSLAYDLQSRLYLKQMDFQRAASFIELAIRIEEGNETCKSPILTMLYSNLSFCLTKCKHWERASSANDKALEHWNLGGLNLQHQLSAIKDIRYMIDNQIDAWEQ